MVTGSTAFSHPLNPKMSSIDADEDDLLAGDLPGNNRSRKLKQKRAVKVNYDSESSQDDDDEGQDDGDSNSIQEDGESDKEDNPVEKENIHDNDDDDDDDMFASDTEKEAEKVDIPTSAPRKSKPKKNSTLDMDKFEKEEGIENYKLEVQDEVEASEKATSEFVEDEEKIRYYSNIEDLDDTQPKMKWEPKIEAFNLREEADEGTFDTDCNYVRKNPNDDEDSERVGEDHWIDGVKSADILKAKESQQKRERLAKEKTLQSARLQQSTGELLAKIIEILEPVETPLEALKRLAPPKKRRSEKKRSKQHQSVGNTQEEAMYALSKNLILDITDICDLLANEKAISGAYDLEREEFMRLYKTETGEDFRSLSGSRKRAREDEPEDSTNNVEVEEEYGDKIWEFRWTDDPDTVNGPYSTYEMKYWKESYFENKVEVRKVGAPDFTHVAEIEFDS